MVRYSEDMPVEIEALSIPQKVKRVIKDFIDLECEGYNLKLSEKRRRALMREIEYATTSTPYSSPSAMVFYRALHALAEEHQKRNRERLAAKLAELAELVIAVRKKVRRSK